ncbi:hypothetical protein [Streptomyces sp. GSL17-111]|uniref:hypothetical protein n=1 Tax=Streptomyces sp. GSL17-111 TaxID=3121596 RepID=UPI0030F379BD
MEPADLPNRFGTFTSAQSPCVDMIIDYLARNGTIDVGALHESPFGSLAPRNTEELFEKAEIDQIAAVIRGSALLRSRAGCRMNGLSVSNPRS